MGYTFATVAYRRVLAIALVAVSSAPPCLTSAGQRGQWS